MSASSSASSRISARRAAISGVTGPPLTDEAFEALRRILLDTGDSVSREAQIELLLDALWWRRLAAGRMPVSVKGVVIRDGATVLLQNERDEWELPGGRLAPGESPAECVVREIREECGLEVAAGRVLDSWVYEPVPGGRVLIITYQCRELASRNVTVSQEHSDAKWMLASAIDEVPMPEGYRTSIRACTDDSE